MSQVKVITEKDLEEVNIGFTFYEKVEGTFPDDAEYLKCIIIGDIHYIPDWSKIKKDSDLRYRIDSLSGYFKRRIDYFRESMYSSSTPNRIKLSFDSFISKIREDMKLMPKHRTFLKEYKKLSSGKPEEVGGWDGFGTFEEEFHGSVDGDYLGG